MRYIETEFGILSLTELAPLIAERVGNAAFDISEGRFTSLPVEPLLLELHRCVCGGVTSRFAGRWRLKNVRIGSHQPPDYWRVPALMRAFSADVAERLRSQVDAHVDRQVEDLAFAEGQFLSIHPFEDFNGRTARLFLTELLYRMNLPTVNTATETEAENKRYLEALQAFDDSDPRPLREVWRQRFGRPQI